MAKLTDAMLRKIMPYAPKKAREAALPILNYSAYQYDITTAERMRMWLSALAIESGELKYQEEIASGAAYEGRKDLGNTEKGDGEKFKGRGRIQLTGRDVYTAYRDYVKKSGHLPYVDFVKHPEMVAQEPYATDSAAWFVNGFKKLHPLADSHQLKAYHMKVNGRRKNPVTGEYEPNHWKERQKYYLRAKEVIPSDWELTEPDPQSLLTEEGKKALEGTNGFPDFDVIPMTEKDNPAEPNGADDLTTEPVSDWEGGASTVPTLTDKNGSEGLESQGNAMSQTSSEPTKDETPQKIEKERPSLFSRILTTVFTAIATAIGGITATCGGNEITNMMAKRGAERVVEGAGRDDLYTFGLVLAYILVGSAAALCLFWIGAKIYERSAERANRLNQSKLDAAKSKQTNTVEFVEKK